MPLKQEKGNDGLRYESRRYKYAIFNNW